jgi:hypothetical protein
MSHAPAASTPPAGWYPDPIEPSVLRYWDGAGWTHHLQPAPQPIETAARPGWLTNRTALFVVIGLIVLATVAFLAFGGSDDAGSATGGATAPITGIWG